MITSPVGINLIKKFEGVSLVPYKCPGGILTIGYGHTATVKPGMKITIAEAEKLLKDDLGIIEKQVSNLVKVPLSQSNFDALVSFVYNVGVTNFKRSTLLRKLNAKKYFEAADQFLVWNKIGDKVSSGLTKRRMAERNLFLAL